ncbi:MAG: leucine-rich repeat protein [Firmicutes bacterium]|nr:leucine-rich repeat protein [Bacillota bacterium]
MKKKICFFTVMLLCALLCASAFSACVGSRTPRQNRPGENPGDNTPPDDDVTPLPAPVYTVTYNTGGGSKVDAFIALEGFPVFLPVEPAKDGYTFDGWYRDITFTQAATFPFSLTQNVTLYAKWKALTVPPDGPPVEPPIEPPVEPPVDPPVEPGKLATPKLSISASLNRIVWDAVPGATEYWIQLNGGAVMGPITYTYYYPESLNSDAYTIKVSASGGAGTVSSEWASIQYIVGTFGLTFSSVNDGQSYGDSYLVMQGSAVPDGSGRIFIPSVYNGRFVTQIGNSAFANQTALTNPVFGETVSFVGNGAFANTGFMNNAANNSVIYLNRWAVGYKGTIPSNLTFLPDTLGIGEAAFESNTTITSVVVPPGVRRVGSYAFRNCPNLASISIPASVRDMGQSAFLNTAIWSTAENSSVVYADQWVAGVKGMLSGAVTLQPDTAGACDCAFTGQTAMTSITLPAAMIYIGWRAFEYCSSALIIRSIGSSQPATWHSGWNLDNPGRTVIWGYAG